MIVVMCDETGAQVGTVEVDDPTLTASERITPEQTTDAVMLALELLSREVALVEKAAVANVATRPFAQEVVAAITAVVEAG